MLQVKPTRGGSSIGVRVAYGVNDSLVKANEIMFEVFPINFSLQCNPDSINNIYDWIKINN